MPAENKSQIRVAIPRELDPDFLAARARDPGSLSVLQGETMGTSWKLHFQRPPGITAAQVETWVHYELDLVVRQMSHYEPDSELTLFNQAPAGQWQKLSPEFFTVLQGALEIARITEGRYDPTLGQMLRRNGFGPDLFLEENASPPPGWSALEWDPTRSVARHRGGCFLDLSSIAKGYALDRVGERLKAARIFNYLFEIGGEFRGCGIKPDGQPWWVDLDPLRGQKTGLPITRIALSGLSLASSGIAVQSQLDDQNGLRHHLIDPRSGRSAQSKLRAVSVLAPTCLEADAWATALFLMGPEEGPAMARNQELAASFLSEENERYHELASPAFQALLDD